MYFKKFFVVFVWVILIAACNEAGKSDQSSAQNTDSSSSPEGQTETREAFFYRQAIEIHDEVMAKMGKLNGYKKRVQQQSDSIRNMLAFTDFPRQVAQRISRELDSLDLVGKKLQTADSSMNAWMEQFNPDPKLPDSDAKADYFEKQKKSAEAMKKIFFEALEEAEKKYAVPNK